MALPLILADDLDAPLAWRDGMPVSRRQYLADVAALAARLPGAGPMLNFSADRYRFAVGLGAAMRCGQASLMPPNHTPDTVARLRTLFPATYALADAGAPALQLPTLHHAAAPATAAEVAAQTAVPEIDEAA
ncbi:MAG TPA: CoA ligase, partial [Burkholderiaceae bacterium]|nr:CoA ligase [Burkholderiaceae bacterium]